MATSSCSLVSKTCSEFAFKLYNSCLETQNKNILISPVSIFTALCMTLAGAKGMTANQMKEVLTINKEEEIFSQFSKFISYLNEKNISDKMQTANKLYVQKGLNIKTGFTSLLKEIFQSECGISDFINNSAAARDAINSWISLITKEKIKDIIGEIDPQTRLILISAIYFKGFWEKQFSTDLTDILLFHVSPDKSVDVEMMYQKNKFGYHCDEKFGASILELPYKENELSLIIVLPDKVDGLKDIEEKLYSDTFTEMIQNARKYQQSVEVWLPKFKLEESLSLKASLSKMGMEDLFIYGRADLSNIVENGNLYVEEVLHKTFIEVNEEGTEAAAATAVRIVTRSIQIIPQFRADHPFLFFITENNHDVILFMGAFRDPSATAEDIHDEL